MGLEPREPVLLLDLDGVTIYGGNPGLGTPDEIYCLHADLGHQIKQIPYPIILFTHRSKSDTEEIIRFFNRRGVEFSTCVCATEMFKEGIKQWRFGELVRKGLSKKHAIRWVEARFNTTRQNLILIDDRVENLKEVLNEGLRFCIKAPFERSADTIVSYEFSELVSLLKGDCLLEHKGIIELNAVEKSLSTLPVLGVISNRSVGVFERFRTQANRLRKLLKLSR